MLSRPPLLRSQISRPDFCGAPASGVQIIFGAFAFVGALASPVDFSARDNAPSIHWINCSENVPSTLDTTGVNFLSLPSTLHCGQISVPLDYSKPLGVNNKVTLGMAMYRPEKPQGVIFYNAGGSDPNVVVAWQTALNQSQAFSNLLDFDLLMLDTRGTFSSVPLNVSLATVGPSRVPTRPTKPSFMPSKPPRPPLFSLGST